MEYAEREYINYVEYEDPDSDLYNPNLEDEIRTLYIGIIDKYKLFDYRFKYIEFADLLRTKIEYDKIPKKSEDTIVFFDFAEEIYYCTKFILKKYKKYKLGYLYAMNNYNTILRSVIERVDCSFINQS